MGYYIRLLTPSTTLPSFQTLLNSAILPPSITLTIEEGDAEDWSQLLLAHADDTPIATIERNPVAPASLGSEEIAEFLEELEDSDPSSAIDWLRNYLATVKCIYAFQILSGSEKRAGWDAIDRVRNALRELLGGILQADAEGFSNEQGDLIL